MFVSVLVLEDFVQRVGNDRNHFVALRDPVVSSMGVLSQKLDRPRKLPAALRRSRTAGPLAGSRRYGADAARRHFAAERAQADPVDA